MNRSMTMLSAIVLMGTVSACSNPETVSDNAGGTTNEIVTEPVGADDHNQMDTSEHANMSGTAAEPAPPTEAKPAPAPSPAPAATPAPAKAKPAPAPAKPKPAEPAPDPHAGHDMNNM